VRKIMILLVLLNGTALASDLQGLSNLILVSDLFDQIYNENANYTSSPEKIWDTTSVFTALSNAAQATVDRFDACKRDTTINMVATDERYDLPSDFLRIRFVTAIGKATPYEITMKEISENQIGFHRDPEGIPSKYYVYDNTEIHLEPANTTGDTVRVYYVPNAAVFDSVLDTTNIDRAYKNYLILDASERLWRGSSMAREGVMQLVERRLVELKELKEAEATRLEARNVGRSIIEDMVK